MPRTKLNPDIHYYQTVTEPRKELKRHKKQQKKVAKQPKELIPDVDMSVWSMVDNTRYIIKTNQYVFENSMAAEPYGVMVYKVVCEMYYPKIHRMACVPLLVRFDDHMFNSNTQEMNWDLPYVYRYVLDDKENVEPINEGHNLYHELYIHKYRNQAMQTVFDLNETTALKFALHNYLLNIDKIPVSRITKLKVSGNRVYASYELQNGTKASSIFSKSKLNPMLLFRERTLICTPELDELSPDERAQFPIKYWSIVWEEKEVEILGYVSAAHNYARNYSENHQLVNKFVRLTDQPDVDFEYQLDYSEDIQPAPFNFNFCRYDALTDFGIFQFLFEAWVKYFKIRGYRIEAVKLATVFDIACSDVNELALQKLANFLRSYELDDEKFQVLWEMAFLKPLFENHRLLGFKATELMATNEGIAYLKMDGVI